MSGSLRRASKTLMGRLASQHQQKRFAGDLPVKPNKYVEEMATRREHIENEFTWSTRNLTNIAIFAFGVPYLVYSYSVKEFNHTDEKFGRPKRDMWGSSD